MTLYLTCGGKQQTIPLKLPAAAADLKEIYAMLEKMSRQIGTIRIASVDGGADHIEQSLCYADPTDPVELAKLNQIAEKIAAMSGKQKDIFSGALDANSINGLDEVLSVMDRLDEYKAAIQTRNRAMVDRSDLVIFFVERKTGGAYQTMQYAKKGGTTWINLADQIGRDDG